MMNFFTASGVALSAPPLLQRPEASESSPLVFQAVFHQSELLRPRRDPALANFHRHFSGKTFLIAKAGLQH
jgi:hypothetical protein